MTRRVSLNGLDLYDDSGSLAWILQEVDGLGSAPSRYATGERAGIDGSWATRSLRGAKAYTLAGATVTQDPIVAEQAMDALLVATRGDEVPLTFHYASGPRTAFVRLDGSVKLKRITPEAFEWQVPLIALDPNLYLGDGLTPYWSGTTARVSTSGGREIPTTFPFTIDSTVTGGLVAFDNPGTSGQLRLRLDGPLTDPVITVTNGDGRRVLEWSLTIPDGAFLSIDPARKVALLQGQSSRPPAQRGWPRLTGGSNQFRFHASGGGSTGTLTVYAWPAY